MFANRIRIYFRELFSLAATKKFNIFNFFLTRLTAIDMFVLILTRLLTKII